MIWPHRRAGVSRRSYAFGTYPYSNRTRLVGEYSLGVSKFRVLGDFDKRWKKRRCT